MVCFTPGMSEVHVQLFSEDEMSRNERFIPVAEVAARLGVSVRTAWRMSATGELPPPVKLSQRVTRWRESEIEEYMDNIQPVACG